MKFRLTVGPSWEDRHVFLDGVDVSHAVQDVEVVATPAGARVVIIVTPGIEGVIEGEVADIVRRLPVEEV